VSEATDYLEGGLAEVGCERCTAQVRAKKLSPQHTSVQWTLRAVGECAEFTERVASGETTARIAACGSLSTSVAKALS
jgi:hypothetical protein